MQLNHDIDLLGDPCEPARTEWLAARAAEQFADKVPLAEIEREELEALESLINVELRERSEQQ